MEASPSTPPGGPPNAPERRAGFWGSLSHAWDGLIHTVVHQRNMRVHMVAALLVSLVGSGIPLGLAEKVTLLFCVLLVFFAEILNSALEHLVDLAVDVFDERAKVAKDAAAAGVLVLAIGTVVIFAALVVYELDSIVAHGEQIRRQVALGVPFAVLGGALLSGQRPAWSDHLMSLAALLLWAAMIPVSESAVFSAMALGLLVVCVAGAQARRQLRTRSK